MKLKTSGLILIAFLLAGCWPKSLHPFYTEKDVITDPKLAGKWLDTEDGKVDATWTFTEAENKRYDLVIRDDKDEVYKFDARLFILDGQRYLDLFSQKRDMSIIPAHHLLKVTELGSGLQFSTPNFEWLDKWLKENPKALAHLRVMDPENRENRDHDEPVLTAETKDLQSFLRKHKDEEGFWNKPEAPLTKAAN